MSEETPRCRRERLSIDLNDAAQRRELYAAAGTAPALMITDGLLLYLPAATVEALATEIRNNTSVTHWICDISTTAFSVAIGGGTDNMQSIRHVQAADSLKGEQILDLLDCQGWTTEAKLSYITDLELEIGGVLRIRAQLDGIAPRFLETGGLDRDRVGPDGQQGRGIQAGLIRL